MSKTKSQSKTKKKKKIETLVHEEATRKNIPTAEYESIMRKEDQTPIQVAYQRRNRDLDPQLVWRGKDEQDLSDLIVQAHPLYIQEKVHPKVLIDDLKRLTESNEKNEEEQLNLFSDFNGLPDAEAKTEFYKHDANWSNRMILGDSLQVMGSLAEREGLRGKVQCIYFDPPYGIKFNSNFQWSTTKKDVKDGKIDHITREPEQVKAFRDTWRDGIHSYLTYLRDRLTAANDLLNQSGSIFLQIGDENVHLVRDLLDEVFGKQNFIGLITFRKKNMPFGARYIEGMVDYILWYAKDFNSLKFRNLFKEKDIQGASRWNLVDLPDGSTRTLTNEEWHNHKLLPEGSEVYRHQTIKPSGYAASMVFNVELNGKIFSPPKGSCWATTEEGMKRAIKANRIGIENSNLHYRMYFKDYPVTRIDNLWSDTSGASNKVYVVQTMDKVIQRCILMSTDPGDLVIDPTCGSGTTAYIAEQWGRRWITIDTSRVALALARSRIMGARYPYYLLADSVEGKRKEATLKGKQSQSLDTEVATNNIRNGFVYERVPHITLKSIANNSEIDVIYDKYQEVLNSVRQTLNQTLGEKWDEWEVPKKPNKDWSDEVKKIHEQWLKNIVERQKAIDMSIATKSDDVYLFDKPCEDKSKVRVAGPFTVESLSPHRVLTVDEADELLDSSVLPDYGHKDENSFVQMILENLKTAGVQQAHKEDKINFSSVTPYPGNLICAEGRFSEFDGDTEIEKRAAIFIGPEFGTVSRPDLVAVAREAGDSDFDVLITCAFNYDAHSSDFNKLGRIPVLKARMNADLHMADDLKNTGKGNLFVIFGEPDIEILDSEENKIQVKINGVDVFHPNTGEVRSDGPEGIACWFIDTDYNEESFFVRQAYFLGANDPYKSLKTTLKAEIDADAWETLNSDTSRPFTKPKSGRIAVKVINHLGDEVMKIFKVD